MAFSINTNVASLQAQNYLRTNSSFQQKTINRVTSGLRIVNSGDDAAGLAIANGMRSDEAVLTQGVQNANSGLSQLQIADGGMSNISQLLDRARTLATQSASGTFTGDRNVLNSEFQSVLTEIDRQAQSIGLNQGGTFAKSLQVFIGGGKADASGSSTSVITNGSVSVDLSRSTVDTQSLGMKGFTAGYQVAAGSQDAGLYDLGGSNAFTTVAAIVSGNSASATFSLNAPGLGTGITVTANLANAGSTDDVVSAINAGIAAQAQTGSASAAALKASGIAAVIHTGTDGHQQLEFTSGNTAFQVTATNATANALLGNFNAGQVAAGDNKASTGAGKANFATVDASSFVANGSQQYTATYATLANATSDVQVITLSINNSSGVPQTLAVKLDSGAGGHAADIDAAEAAKEINAALQSSANPTLQSLVVTNGNAKDSLTFSTNSPAKFTVSIGTGTGGRGATDAIAGQGSIVTSKVTGTGNTADISSQSNSQVAVTALSTATMALGQAQAVVGRGQNQFNYAINLAQSQLTNTQAAESAIRDADLAAESANLTKAQIMIQAGVAALAQANSAPQQVLTLLQR